MSVQIAAAILLGTVLALGLYLTVLRRVLAAPPGRRPADRPEPLCLLRDGQVIETTPAGRALGSSGAPADDWPTLTRDLRRLWPDLPEQMPARPLRLRAEGDIPLEIRADTDGDLCRLSLGGDRPSRVTLLRLLAQEARLAHLSDAADLSPYPIWRTDARGRVIWANARCETLQILSGNKPLFDLAPEPGVSERHARAQLLTEMRGLPEWFELTSLRVEDGWLHFAVEIDAVVTAEHAQRNFVQTLAKTFANLPTGLAIFDRNRQLALFNPALLDLTGLPPDFLSNRPTLQSFFDQLRENHIMPEPRSYAGWREDMAELVRAASNDRYSDTWTLPSGLTYRINGRPHPDGAIAFLIEDISAEISLTRGFRAELQLNQSVLDALEDAIAVFDHGGTLVFCNASYRALWRCDPDSAFAETTITDATELWRGACRASPVWSELRDFATATGDRASWEAEITMAESGQRLRCEICPIVGSATLVRFSDDTRGALARARNGATHLGTGDPVGRGLAPVYEPAPRLPTVAQSRDPSPGADPDKSGAARKLREETV